MSEPERLHLFQSQEAVLKSKNKTSSQDPSVDQAFLSLEAIVDADFFENFEDFEFIEIDEATVDLPYYETSNGKFITAADYAQAYTDLYNIVNNAVDPTSGEDFLYLDLEIASIDEQNQIVVINSNVALATLHQQQWFIPGSSYWAAVGAGACSTPSTPNNNGTDVADFMNAYANGTAPWKSRCQNGIYRSYRGSISTWSFSTLPFNIDPNTNQDPNGAAKVNIWNNQIIANSWRSNTNDCLGHTNEDWLGFYQDMDAIISGGESLFQFDTPGTEFHLAFWHSHDRQSQSPHFSGNHDLITERYYHAGTFTFAVITCKP
mgnify:CR=1 FL=1